MSGPVALVGGALARALVGHTTRQWVSRFAGSQLGFTAGLNPVAALKTELAMGALIAFDTKTRRAIKRGLNEATRNAYSATVRDIMASTGIKKRKVLTRNEGKGGRIRWYRATDMKLETAMFVGLESEPGLTLVRTGVVKGKPSKETIAKANRRKREKGKHAEKFAARAEAAGLFPGLLRTTHGRPYSKLFWAHMPNSGHIGIFSRRTRKRLQIDEPYIAIRGFAEHFGKRHMEQQFRDTFPRALMRNLGI